MTALPVWVKDLAPSEGPVIEYRGGGYKMGKSRVWIILRHAPQDRVKSFLPLPLYKGGNFFQPPFSMATTSSAKFKLPQYLLCPPFNMAKPLTPLLFVSGKSWLVPPSHFEAPPPPFIN